ncbi:MAG TPA: tetratricopeptide repeat protein [Saprospiraceae bacterium]|nr:tetratricopeptide repeat protein [Saprospiraceae bacterium]
MPRFLTLIFCFFLFAQASPAQSLTERYYKKGVEFQEKAIYSRAIDYYTEVLNHEPQHVEARYNRAVVYFEIKEYRKALFDVRTLLEAHPMDPDLHSLTGLIYAKLKEPDEAIRYINRALEIQDEPIFHLRKADILLQNKQPELAFKELYTALEDPDLEPSILELRAIAYVDLHQPNQAIGTYTHLINLNPRPEYYYNRGLLRRRIKDVAGACNDFKEASKEPFFEEALEALIHCQWEQNDTAAVEATGKNGIIHFPNNPTFYLFSGLAALRKGKSKLAVKWFNKAEQLGLKSAEVYINKGLALLQYDKQKAKEAFLLALKIDATNKVARHNLDLLGY